MISEPVTLVTDYLLGAVSAWLAFKTLKISRFWALAFLAVSVAAFFGGTWHGWVRSDPLWKATLLAAGVASFGMLAGSAIQATTGAARALLLGFAVVKVMVYGTWMLARDEFIWVIADTGVSLLVLAGLYLWRLNGWMLAGVAVSAAAGAVQASGFALHRNFNHNDLYHLIEIGALLLFYRGLSVKR